MYQIPNCCYITCLQLCAGTHWAHSNINFSENWVYQNTTLYFNLIWHRYRAQAVSRRLILYIAARSINTRTVQGFLHNIIGAKVTHAKRKHAVWTAASTHPGQTLPEYRVTKCTRFNLYIQWIAWKHHKRWPWYYIETHNIVRVRKFKKYFMS